MKLYHCKAKVIDSKTNMNITFDKHLVAKDRNNAIGEIYRLMKKSLDREETKDFSWEVMELDCNSIGLVYGYDVK